MVYTLSIIGYLCILICYRIGEKTWPKKITIDTATQNSSALVSFNSAIKEVTNMTRQNVSEYSSTPLLITKIMDGIKNQATTEDGELKVSEPSLPICDEIPPELGKF